MVIRRAIVQRHARQMMLKESLLFVDALILLRPGRSFYENKRFGIFELELTADKIQKVIILCIDGLSRDNVITLFNHLDCLKKNKSWMESYAFNWIRNLKFWRAVSSFKHTCSRHFLAGTNDHHCFNLIHSIEMSPNYYFSRMDLKNWQVCGTTVNYSLLELSNRKIRLEGLGILGRK